MDDLDSCLDDVLIFELPAFEDVEAFCEHFRSRWPGWVHADAGVWLFAADLGGLDDGLPVLLREAQRLVSELGLAAIRFYLDGCAFALEAVAPAPEADGAAALHGDR
jgi:hypothetical protein